MEANTDKGVFHPLNCNSHVMKGKSVSSLQNCPTRVSLINKVGTENTQKKVKCTHNHTLALIQ